MRKIAILLSVIFLIVGNAYAERGIDLQSKSDNYSQKIALVIGNSTYKSSPLKNPQNDAKDMTAQLRELGFKVISLTNATQRQMRKSIRNFGNQLKKGGVGLFFFAGHGMQVNGKNYLIPIGADIQEENEVQDYAVDAGSVLRKMQSAGNPLNMVFLDACRNNPYARSFRSSNRGLAQMDAPTGSLIVYATAPGSVAADGGGRNGIFTKNLLNHMRKPGVEVGRMLRNVRRDVLRDTANKQTPWDSSSLIGEFYFNRNNRTQVAALQIKSILKSTPTTINAEEELWNEISKSQFIEEYEDYLSAYPYGRFVTLAKIKIKRLKRSQKKETNQKLGQKKTPKQSSLSSGLVAYYPFNGNANDESGNSNNGIVHGAKLSVDRFGNSERAYQFDGNNDYITVKNSSELSPPILTISLWFMASSVGRGSGWHKRLISKAYHYNKWKSPYVQYEMLLATHTEPVINGTLRNSRKYKSTTGQKKIHSNKWYHLTGIYEENGWKVFLNGKLNARLSVNSVLTNRGTNMFIGCRSGPLPSELWDGKIDDIRIYNRALTHSEVRELHLIRD